MLTIIINFNYYNSWNLINVYAVFLCKLKLYEIKHFNLFKICYDYIN